MNATACYATSMQSAQTQQEALLVLVAQATWATEPLEQILCALVKEKFFTIKFSMNLEL